MHMCTHHCTVRSNTVLLIKLQPSASHFRIVCQLYYYTYELSLQVTMEFSFYSLSRIHLYRSPQCPIRQDQTYSQSKIVQCIILLCPSKLYCFVRDCWLRLHYKGILRQTQYRSSEIFLFQLCVQHPFGLGNNLSSRKPQPRDLEKVRNYTVLSHQQAVQLSSCHHSCPCLKSASQCWIMKGQLRKEFQP